MFFHPSPWDAITTVFPASNLQLLYTFITLVSSSSIPKLFPRVVYQQLDSKKTKAKDPLITISPSADICFLHTSLETFQCFLITFHFGWIPWLVFSPVDDQLVLLSYLPRPRSPLIAKIQHPDQGGLFRKPHWSLSLHRQVTSLQPWEAD